MLRLIICIVCLCSTPLFATISVSHGFSHNQATLGQEIRYSRIITANINDTIPPVVFDEETWGPFTIKTSNQESGTYNNKKIFRFDAIVSAFELGKLTWPSQNLSIIREGTTLSTTLPPLDLTIIKQIKDNTQAKIRDIKPPISLPFPTQFWLIVCSIIILLTVIAWIIYKRLYSKELTEESIPPEKVDARSPYEIAIDSINTLYSKKLIQENKVKRHYLTLTDILKRYLEMQLSVSLLEKTSLETLHIISEKVDSQTQSRLKNIFSTADFVKYAKLTPSEQDHIDAKKRVYTIIERLKEPTS